jgi:hypothetical protein
MGAIIFSTNENNRLIAAQKIFEKKGFSSCTFKKTEKGTTLIYYCKKHYKGIYKSYYENNNGDYIVSTGTIFYRDLFGEDALSLLLEDFSLKNFDYIEKNSTGHFFIFIKKGCRKYFFTDRSEHYMIYYSLEEGIILSTSFTALIASLKKKKISLNRMYEYICLGPLNIDRTTILEGVYIFSGDKIGVVDSRGVQLIDKPEFEIINFPSDKDAISNVILDYFHRYFSPLKKYFNGKISAEITGGVDTRLILSLLEKENIDYSLLHYNINPEDLKIAKLISSKEKKKIFIYDSENDSFMNDESQYKSFLDNLGYALFDNFFYIFGLNPKSFVSYVQVAKLGMLCLSGDGGELFSQDQWTLNKKQRSINEIIKHYSTLDSINYNFYVNKEAYCRYLSNVQLKLTNFASYMHTTNIKNVYLLKGNATV